VTAARAHRLSPFVHAVDSTGSLCGATARGRWLLSEVMPVTCPRCLLRLGRPRWATCETPTATARGSHVHLRRVGPEGIELSRNPSGARTLCGQLAGWDLAEVPSISRAAVELVDRGARVRGGLCPTCRRTAVEPHLEEARLA
jgi:hypothetical protein